MTSQQSAAILHASGLTTDYPSVHVNDLAAADALLAAAGLEKRGEHTFESGGDPFVTVDYATANGVLSIYGPAPAPSAVLGAVTMDDRIALTDEGREALEAA